MTQDVQMPEQRYWRRRANMRVRKRRWARNSVRLLGLVTLQSLVAAVLVYAAVQGFGRLIASGAFAVQTVELRGDRRADGAAILIDLSRLKGRNLFDVDLREVVGAVEQDPWVLAVSVRRVLPGTLRVQIEERVPSAVALLSGGAHLVDATGHVMGPLGPGLSADLPVLTGLGTTAPERDQAVRRGVALLERLRARTPRFVDAVSEFDLSGTDLVAVRTVQPGPRLLLDPAEIERNIDRYLDLRGEIAQQVGTASYVDLRWRGRITVMPEREHM